MKTLTAFGQRGRAPVRTANEVLPRVRDNRPVFLLINHRLGGGTARHVGSLEHALRNQGVRAIVVRRVWPGDYSGKSEMIYAKRSGAASQQSIQHRSRKCSTPSDPFTRHVHHSLGLPDALFDALADRQIQYDWTIHDYHTICPRINLIGSAGRYCGEPDEAACNHCLSRLGADSGRPVSESITGWREKRRPACGGPARVVPSTMSPAVWRCSWSRRDAASS